MTFRAAALARDTGLRFALEVQGIPYLFLDGPSPVGPDGTTWAVPTTAGGLEYVWQEHCLDVDASPPRDPGAYITRSKSEVSSATMAWTLRDDAVDTLLNLFARARATGQVANLRDSVAYDVAATGAINLPVDSTSGWDAGLAYFGRETLYINAIGPDSLSGLRDLYNSLGYGDTQYRANTARPGAPRVVSSYPRIWHGRYVRLWAWVVGGDGTAYDDAWGGTYMAELWRGTIDGNPTPARDGLSWDLRATSIEAILHTMVGRETARASMLRAVGGVVENVSPSAPPEGLVLLTGDLNAVHFIVSGWVSSSSYLAGDPPAVSYDHSDGVNLASQVPRVVAPSAIPSLWVTVSNTVSTDTSGLLTWSLQLAGTTAYLSFSVTAGATVAFYRVEVFWNLPGSVGPLLGVSGSTSYVFSNTKTFVLPGLANAVYVPANATMIPFYYDPTEGTVDDSTIAPASGYARIGEGESAEIVSYTGVEAVDVAELAGVYLLTGVTRGRLGTTATAIAVPIGLAEKGEKTRVTFGVGYEATDVARVLLELATSTGGGHHGAYDVLAADMGAPLNPSHFDLARIEQMAGSMAPAERQMSIFVSKPEKLSELITSWLQPQGRFVHAAMLDDGTYRITPGEVLPALEALSTVTVDVSAVDWHDPTQWRPGASEVVNEIKALYRYDTAKDSWVEAAYVRVLDQDSAEEYGKRSAVEWKLRGAVLTPDQARSMVLIWAQDVFRRYGRPYEILRVKVGRTGWFLRPGSTVTLALDYLPDGLGGRGLSGQAVVLQVDKRFAGPDVGATVDLVVEAAERVTAYAPSARITSYDAGGPTITLASAGFGSADGSPDYEYFDAGDVVWVYEDEGDFSTRVERTIVARTGSVCTLSSALSGGWTAGDYSLVMPSDYGSVTTAQRRWAYIAPNASVFAVAPTEAFRYV